MSRMSLLFVVNVESSPVAATSTPCLTVVVKSGPAVAAENPAGTLLLGVEKPLAPTPTMSSFQSTSGPPAGLALSMLPSSSNASSCTAKAVPAPRPARRRPPATIPMRRGFLSPRRASPRPAPPSLIMVLLLLLVVRSPRDDPCEVGLERCPRVGSGHAWSNPDHGCLGSWRSPSQRRTQRGVRRILRDPWQGGGCCKW